MNMERIRRSCVATALVALFALAATLLVPAASDAQTGPPPDQACIIHVFHSKLDCDREQAVAEMVTALESYAEENGTYWVEDSGFRGRGTGWVFWEQAGSTYPTSVASVLADEGHLFADITRGPVWSAANDMMVYRCKDRVAVFITDSAEEPTSDDSDWWANNDCFTYPIDRFDATYFQVSAPLTS